MTNSAEPGPWERARINDSGSEQWQWLQQRIAMSAVPGE
jgi:hypothetical protein